MRIDPAWKNVSLLAVCQALAFSGSSLIATTSALVGNSLASDKGYATLPIALQFLATMLTTIPASHLMRRIGRRRGFILGALLGIAGAATNTVAIFASDFLLFALGSAITGTFYGFALFFRFAAADVADERRRATAISLVLAGGVAAAIIGPNLARLTRTLFEPVLFAGCYFSLIGLYLGIIGVISFVRIPTPSAIERRESGRPVRAIVRQPACLTAMLCGPIAYGVMALIMTATPLAMLACDLSFSDTAFVIQWHVLGMYAPSFVTGHLISRVGVLNVMAVGAVLLAACVGINLSGTAINDFWAALALLGIGWNFVFIGSTTLLTQAYQPAERAKIQGLNDFLLYGMVTLSALVSGKIQHAFGWDVVNLGVAPFIAVAFAMSFWLRTRRAPAAA
ncbi:MAG: MFS transporter [Alphaproteobacteria bacterium]